MKEWCNTHGLGICRRVVEVGVRAWRDMCSSRLDILMHGAAAALEGKDDDDDDAEEFICSTSD